jgi:hypothetical protein
MNPDEQFRLLMERIKAAHQKLAQERRQKATLQKRQLLTR